MAHVWKYTVAEVIKGLIEDSVESSDDRHLSGDEESLHDNEVSSELSDREPEIDRESSSDREEFEVASVYHRKLIFKFQFSPKL